MFRQQTKFLKTPIDSRQLTNENKTEGQETDNCSNSFLNFSRLHENNLIITEPVPVFQHFDHLLQN